jgi:hypothetical protein
MLSLGTAATAERVDLEAAIRLIQAPDSPFTPTDNQTPTAADVTPAYVLETWHNGDRYEADVEIITKAGKPSKGYKLWRARMIPQDAQTPRFEATSIGVGK